MVAADDVKLQEPLSPGAIYVLEDHASLSIFNHRIHRFKLQARTPGSLSAVPELSTNWSTDNI